MLTLNVVAIAGRLLPTKLLLQTDMHALSSETWAFIQSRRVGHLATVDDTAHPHVVPVCFALEEDHLYIAIDEKPKAGHPEQLRRLRNIGVNPNVQVLFDEYDDGDWTRLHFVQLRGRARVLRNGSEFQSAIRALRERYTQYRDMGLEDRPVIAVAIESFVEWSAKDR
jgi:PPOX class probable F420-dependent enzyme